VDLIEVQVTVPGKAREEGDELVGISDLHPQHLHQTRSVLAGEEPGEGRLAQAGLTGNEQVSHGLAPRLRGVPGETEVLQHPALPDEVTEAQRADSRLGLGRRRRGSGAASLGAARNSARSRPSGLKTNAR
jgi:hypothetical protein